MSYFAVPYRVLFHDTMAYGSHHFLTNFKFQCEAREHLLFAEVLRPGEEASFDDVLFITQQAYSRNLAPVKVGEMVGILLSIEEPTTSSTRFCFRVLRYDGAPVACGFQTVICMSRQTQQLMAAPQPLIRYRDVLREPLTEPSFAERILNGRLQSVFSEDVVKLGMEVACAPAGASYPCIVSPANAEEPKPVIEFSTDRGLVFLFPGQGSYRWPVLGQLQALDATNKKIIGRVDEIASSELGYPLLPLVNVASEAEYKAVLSQHPDLVQLGIYLAGVLSARFLIEHGLRPDILTGHSAGEFSALAVSGAYDVEIGAELVCKRVAALASLASDLGGMMVLFCDQKRTLGLIEALGNTTLEPSVINHPEQTVVSGALADLESLAQLASHLKINQQRVQSRYPFHSQLLQPLVEPLTLALGSTELGRPSIPVYSPIERSFYSEGAQLAALLPPHFVKHLRFDEGVEDLYRFGGRNFIECGSGTILTRLVPQILQGKPDVHVWSTMPAGKLVGDGLRETLTSCAEHGLCEPIVAAPAEAVVQKARSSEVSVKGEVPIAIVSLGCVLPGAGDPEQLWENVKRGTSAIRDGAELSPNDVADFLSPGGTVPDKTYTLMTGVLPVYDVSQLPPQARAIATSRCQQILALATMQCLAGLKQAPEPARLHYLIGATADGTIEFDEALLLAGLDELSGQLNEAPADVERFRKALRLALATSPEKARLLAPHSAFSAVAETLLGAGVKVLVADAACASSLYTIALGMRALRDGDCDVAFCGGVFAPGPANSCLFSQFRGLSPTGSRPFDATADGVVFSPGAALVVLKRLPEALAAGDHIHALIQGYGTSSDGKSPSVAEPKKVGQTRALQRAYASCQIDPATIQYVEAHATSTPVGDAVEFQALDDVFKGRGGKQITLGSIKALIGHAGWAAGAASVIKVCQAFKHNCLPPQVPYAAPNPGIQLSGSPFVIPSEPRPWSRGDTPRRAGINGFGFGGTNAHLILEEYEEEVHGSWHAVAPHTNRLDQPLALVGLGAIFPSSDAPKLNGESGRQRFESKELRLPKGKLVLPEVVDHIDPGQFLALMAAEQALEATGAHWKNWRSEIGVVLGVEAKTSRSLSAVQRIYVDSLRRRLAERSAEAALSDEDLKRMQEKLIAAIQRLPQSTPYTLSGMMPNVIAGRVANIFDLHGPNLTVDAGSASLIEALRVADAMLRRGECKMVLAGGISGNAGVEAQFMTARHAETTTAFGEAGLMLALMSLETAQAEGLPILARFSFEPGISNQARSFEVGRRNVDLMGAEGALEIIQAVEHVRESAKAATVDWPTTAALSERRLRFDPVLPAVERSMHAEQRDAGHHRAESLEAEPQKFQSDKVQLCTPGLRPVAVNVSAEPFRLARKKILCLVDQPEALRFVERIQNIRLICPASADVPGAIKIDLSTDETTAAGLQQLDGHDFDVILALKDLTNSDSGLVLIEGAQGQGLFELLFVAARHSYGRLQAGNTMLAALSVGASYSSKLDPYTGLLGGLIKSLARELPESICKAIHTNEREPAKALAQVEIELGQGPLPAPVEVVYTEGKRSVFQLVPLKSATRSLSPTLERQSVVVATAGGRGVTAGLVEALLERVPCTIVLLGRTDLEALPANLRAMDEPAFENFERSFYEQELKRTPGVRIIVLRDRYKQYRAAREVLHNIEEMRRRGGQIVYRCVDITDATAVDNTISDIVREYGRLDYVLHGAGLQSSRLLVDKKLPEFRRVVATKLGGLLNLYESCQRHLPGRSINYHLLTSAFSFFGNDGQPDYGAANEAMNRIAAQRSGKNGDWTTIAWLGWAGVGMTRGSEYAVLAQGRGLYPLPREEGKRIFSAFLEGAAAAPVNVLVTEGERKFYDVTLASAESTNGHHGVGPSHDECWQLSVAAQPYLEHHKVKGVPTLAGTFEIELAVRSAQQLRPDRHVASIEEVVFDRFVRIFPLREVELSARARVLQEDERETLVQVELYSDFIHKSGRVLQKDLLHFAARVRLATERAPAVVQAHPPNGGPSLDAIDPYVSPQAPVWLGGFFRCLRKIELQPNQRHGCFRIEDDALLPQLSPFITPSILLDALCRLAMIHVEPEGGGMPIYVPFRCSRILLPSNLNDLALHRSGAEIKLYAANPIIEGDLIRNERTEATDANGKTLLVVEQLVARRFGAVSV